MKYMLKRIIIGVVIGFILMSIKSCEVHAASKYLYNFDTKVASMSFDACQKNGNDFLCVDGFSKDLTINNNYQLIYSNNNQIITLKSLSLSLVYSNNDFQILRYGNLTYPIYQMFNNNNNTGYDNNKLRVNNFLSYVKITTQDNVVCEISDNVGASVSTSFSPYAILPYFEVPTNCRNKYLKQLDLVFQNGYNYSGNDSIFSTINFTTGMNVNDYVNNNKNNSYLLSWGLDSKTLNHNLAIAQNMNNIQLYFGSSPYSSNVLLNTYTIESQQIQENIAKLEKEKLLASLGGTDLGPDYPNQSNYEDLEDSISDIQTDINNISGSTQFTDFLNALTQKPIVELLYLIRENPTDDTTVSCGNLPYIPFKVNHNTGDSVYGMTLPCVSEYLDDIPYMYGASGYGFGVIDLYQMILTAYFTYLLILTWLNLIKYTITRSSSEIEVIEL